MQSIILLVAFTVGFCAGVVCTLILVARRYLSVSEILFSNENIQLESADKYTVRLYGYVRDIDLLAVDGVHNVDSVLYDTYGYVTIHIDPTYGYRDTINRLIEAFK